MIAAPGGPSDAPYRQTNGTHSLHARLRHGTADHHDRIDRALGYLLDDRLSKDRYADLVAAFLGFYGPHEEDLERWGAASPPLGLPLIRRAGLLQQDLHALGRVPERVPLCAALPALTTVEHVAGAIYVIEGACLGGQVIARSVVRRLGLGRENGAAFFIGDGARTAGRWKQVLAWLDERNRDPGAADEIVLGACRTFAALSQWLTAREVLDE